MANMRRRILMLVAPRDFFESEYSVSCAMFAEKGIDVAVATEGNKAVGAHGATIETDLEVSKADVSDFDALFVVGGKGMIGFSDNEAAQRLLRGFVDAGKPVALICYGPLLAAKAGLVKDRQVTGWPDIRLKMSTAGAQWTGMPIERDGDLFTAVGPEDAESLADILVRRIDCVPILAKAVLGKSAALRKLAWLWRLADELDKPMTDDEAIRWLQEFEREEFNEVEPEPVAPKETPVVPTALIHTVPTATTIPTPTPTPTPTPIPTLTPTDTPTPETFEPGLEKGKWRQREPKHEWNISVLLNPPKTDGTWPDVPETPPTGFPFPADALKDGASLRALFQKPETWEALVEMAANPSKRGMIQSYLLPKVVLAIGRSWWNINKRRKQLHNAPFGLFSPDEYKDILAGESGGEGHPGLSIDESVPGRAFIALINWRVAKILQFILATGSPGAALNIDAYIYHALDTEMTEEAGKRHGLEAKRLPTCAYCAFKRMIKTTPPFLIPIGKHKVQEKGSSKSRPMYKCPTCSDLLETKEQELRLKEQGVNNAEQSLREMGERLRDSREKLARDPGNTELKNRVESQLSMWNAYVPQVKALVKECDDLRTEIQNRRNMLNTPRQHIGCINENCPGFRIPLTFVDWESPFWTSPEGTEARRKLASVYGIVESGSEQKADDTLPKAEQIADRPGKKPPPWMWNIPFRCPFDGARFTPAQAFGRGKPTRDGSARLGGIFTDPPPATKWVKQQSLEQETSTEKESARRVEETRTQTGIDTTTDSDKFLTDQNEKMYYEELAGALRQEFFRRKEIHAARTKGLDGNRTAKLEALLYEALLEWSFVHPLHLVGYFTKRMPSVRKVIDKDSGDVRKHLEIRSLGPNGAEQIVSSLIQTWFTKIVERNDAQMLLRGYLTSEDTDKVPPQGYFLSVVKRGADGELEAPCHLRYTKGSPIGEKPPRGTSYGRDIYIALVQGIWDYNGPHGERELMTPIPPAQGDALVSGKTSHLDEMESHNSHKIVFDSATSLREGSPIIVKALFMPRHTAWTPIKRVMHLRKDLADPEDDMAGIMDIVGRLADNREEDVKMFARWRKTLRQLGMPWQVKKFDEELQKRLAEKGVKHSKAFLLAEAKDPLAKYKGKRKFDETPEPEGKKEKSRNQHRFVIQLHHAKRAKDHYDLRLENDDGTLSSWSIPKHRLPKGKEKLLAVKTEDHPVEYMKFEGCFRYDTVVQTDDGWMRINQIYKTVRQGKKVSVLSYNQNTLQLEWKKVLNVFVNGKTNTFLHIKFDDNRYMVVTRQHPVYTANGTKVAGDLSIGESVYTFEEGVLGDVPRQVLLGTLLGDAHIDEYGCLQMAHCCRQLGYLQLKSKWLGIRTSIKKHASSNSYFVRKTSKMFRMARHEFYPSGTKSVSSSLLDQLDERGIAIWYMDCGFLTQGKYATLRTYGFSQKENQIMADWLKNRWDIDATVHYAKPEFKGTGGFFIHMSRLGTMRFLTLVNDYVVPSMRYKTYLQHFCDRWPSDMERGFVLIQKRIREIETVFGSPCRKYDLHVEDNHNYFAGGALVSNSIPVGEYGAGTMEIHDSGTYDEIETSKTKIVFRLKGKKEKGTYNLFRAGDDDKKWMITPGKEASFLPPFSKRIADEK